MVERMNRTLGAMLRQYMNEQQTEWDEWLPYCAMAYNSSRHSSTGYTPHMLMFGREMRIPLELVLPSPEEEDGEDQKDGEDTVDHFLRKMELTFWPVYALTREHLQAAVVGQK